MTAASAVAAAIQVDRAPASCPETARAALCVRRVLVFVCVGPPGCLCVPDASSGACCKLRTGFPSPIWWFDPCELTSGAGPDSLKRVERDQELLRRTGFIEIV